MRKFLLGVFSVLLIAAAGDTVFTSLQVTGATDLDGALDVAGATTLAAITSSATVTGEQLTSTDDATITDDLTAGSVSSAAVATSLQVIRFCGNGPDGATPTYVGPVLLDDTEADLAFGGAGCDALDNTTEATADAPWHAAWAFKPVGMSCVGQCTGATAANDAIVFQLRDDTADVTDITCTTAAMGGDATPAQCSVRDANPATVAANSAIAVEITLTDDDCNDVGDDFECLLYVAFE